MKEIKNINLAKVRNAEHFQFHADMLAAVTAEFATAQKLNTLRNEYAALFQKEDEAFVQSRALTGTADVEQKDAARDSLYIYLCQMVDTKCYSPLPAEKAAAERLTIRISPYRQAHTKPYAENTALVTNLVTDLQGKDCAADITLLGLTDAVTALKAANEEFNTAYTERSDEKQMRESNEKMKTIRPQVDTAYRTLADAINALYRVNELVTKDAEAETALGAVMDRMNALILQLNQTLTTRSTRAANKAETMKKQNT